MQLASLAEIDTHVAQHGKPFVVSLAEDTHVFHFEADGNWRNADILFVNRNGHQFRLIKQSDGKWLFCKTWNTIDQNEDWMIEANLRRSDPEDLIALCGIGPQGRNQTFETLSLLPKGTTHRRKAVWRNHILDVRFNMDANTFTLTSPQGMVAETFSGKLWESKEAAKWCLANLPPPIMAAATVKSAAVREQELEVLEDNELWGMF